jgi:hypothetical protein
MRHIFIVVIALLAGCSQIVKNEYYSAKEASNGWKLNYSAGKMSGSKSYPSLDKLEHLFIGRNFEVSVSSGYQKIDRVGPLLLPVIPVGDDGSAGNLEVVVELSCTACNFDFSKLLLRASNENYLPSVREMNLETKKVYILLFPVSFSEVNNFSLLFDEVTSEMPILEVFKTEGKSFVVNVSL